MYVSYLRNSIFSLFSFDLIFEFNSIIYLKSKQATSVYLNVTAVDF